MRLLVTIDYDTPDDMFSNIVRLYQYSNAKVQFDFQDTGENQAEIYSVTVHPDYNIVSLGNMLLDSEYVHGVELVTEFKETELTFRYHFEDKIEQAKPLCMQCFHLLEEIQPDQYNCTNENCPSNRTKEK